MSSISFFTGWKEHALMKFPSQLIVAGNQSTEHEGKKDIFMIGGFSLIFKLRNSTISLI